MNKMAHRMALNNDLHNNNDHIISSQYASYEHKKALFLAVTLGIIIGTYSILRPLKSAVFMGLVGVSSIPKAKLAMMFFGPAFALFYSRLIDTFKRHTSTQIILGGYSVILAVFAILLSSPAVWEPGAHTTTAHILGWCFYGFLDIYSLAIVSTFWALINSLSSPKSATSEYSYINSASRIGGVCTAAIVYWISCTQNLPTTTAIPLFLGMSSILLFMALIATKLMYRHIPRSHLIGYAAQHETKRQAQRPGLISGLKSLLSQPYLMGIVVGIYSFEFIATFVDYQMHSIINEQAAGNIAIIHKYLMGYTCGFQILSLIIAFIGAPMLLKRFNLSVCLAIGPAVAIILILGLSVYKSLIVVTGVMMILRALNYGFNVPVREMLYIPCSQTIQFKSKAWNESFGRTTSETSGSLFNNYVIPHYSASTCNIIGSTIAISLATLWLICAIATGRKYKKTVDNDEIIGSDS